MKLELSGQIFDKSQISNFMKIHPMGAELFQVDGRTDRYDDANSRFSQFLRTRLKINNHDNVTKHQG
jgi:hypothetical protein